MCTLFSSVAVLYAFLETFGLHKKIVLYFLVNWKTPGCEMLLNNMLECYLFYFGNFESYMQNLHST